MNTKSFPGAVVTFFLFTLALSAVTVYAADSDNPTKSMYSKGAQPSNAAIGKLSTRDGDFVTKAALASLTEAKAGNSADGRTNNASVLKFAKQMFVDHTAAYDELSKFAKAKSVILPVLPDSAQSALTERLLNSKGIEFDKLFIDEIALKSHKEAVELFTEAARHSDDPALRAYATKTLPILRRHMQMGESLARSVNKSIR